jgi:hypothetical protein
LQLRFFPDVADGEFVASPAVEALWGKPIVTIFAYLVEPGITVPRPIAIMPYQSGLTTTVFIYNCGGGVGPVLCKNLTPSHGSWQPSSLFDWEKALQSQAGLAIASVTNRPGITNEVEQSLNKLLVAQHENLRKEVNRRDGELYRSINDLDGTVSAIRGLVALTLPGPSAYDDKLRSMLYGRPERHTCRRVASRVDDSNAGTASNYLTPEEDNPFSPSFRKIKKTEAKSTDVKECSLNDGVDDRNSPELIDYNIMTMFLSWGVGQDGNTIAELLDDTNLLRNLDLRAQYGSDEFMITVARDLTEVTSKGNRHPFLQYYLGQLRALRNTIDSIEPRTTEIR